MSEHLPVDVKPEAREPEAEADMGTTVTVEPDAAPEPVAVVAVVPESAAVGVEPVSEGAVQAEDANLRAILKDVGSRLPNYARFSQGLVAAGLMSANEQANLLGPLGVGPLAQVTRFIPLLSQVTRILQLVGAVHFALTQLDPVVAEQHLANAGLTRAQVEADFQASKGLAARAAATGSEHAAKALEVGAEVGSRALEAAQEHVARAVEVAAPIANEKLHQGAKRAGRLAGLGVRALRDWQNKPNRGDGGA